MEQTQEEERQRLVEIARNNGIAYMAVFGSYARGEARPDSDIDLYIRFGRQAGLFEMLGIKHEFEDAVGRSVDLIAEELVEPYSFVRDSMARDLTVIYDASATHVTAR